MWVMRVLSPDWRGQPGIYNGHRPRIGAVSCLVENMQGSTRRTRGALAVPLPSQPGPGGTATQRAAAYPTPYLLKTAWTDVSRVMVTLHAGTVPAHAPLQLTKALPAGGVAVRVTTVPLLNCAEQAFPQCRARSMPFGVAVTEEAEDKTETKHAPRWHRHPPTYASDARVQGALRPSRALTTPLA